MPCTIPGMCSKQADCADTHCPGRWEAQSFLTNTHRVIADEPITTPEEAMSQGEAVWAWIGAALIFGGAAALIAYLSKGTL